MRTLAFYLIVVLSLLQAACGGGREANGEPPASIVEVVIEPGATILTGRGDQRQLSAIAYDANGNPITADITWRVDDVSKVSIDATGRITAEDSVGSTRVTATANGIDSEPILVLLAMPAINALLVEDDQVRGSLAAVNPDAPYQLGYRYQLTVTGMNPLPETGDILIGAGDLPIGGRVVDVVPQPDGSQRVVLELVSLDELFTELVIDETIDLSDVEYEIPTVVTDYYNVTEQSDGSLRYTIKQGAGVFSASASINRNNSKSIALVEEPSVGARAAQDQDDNSFNLGPFECKAPIGDPFVFSLDESTFTLAPSVPDLVISYDSAAGGLQVLAINGTVEGEVSIKASVNSQIDLKLSCDLTLKKIPVPMLGAGPLALFFGGQIPIGVGFEFGGKITVDGFSAAVAAEARATAEVGVDCGSGSCNGITNSTAAVDGSVEFELPSGITGILDNVKVEPLASGFITSGFEAGTNLPFLPDRTLKILALQTTMTQNGNFATVTNQVTDDAYASEYKLTLETKLGPGEDLASLLERFRLTATDFELIDGPHELGTSPRALSASADVASFQKDDIVNFTVMLDGRTVDYPVIGYNVDRVRIYRLIDTPQGRRAERIVRELAADGQTEFNLAWLASEDGSVAGNFFATVLTRVPLPFPIDEMELKSVAGSSSGKIAFASNRGGNWDIYVMNTDGSNVQRLTNHPDYDSEPSWSPDGTKIAFTSDRDGSNDIYVMNADGSNLVNLSQTTGDINESEPAWSPDGSKIAFRGNREVNPDDIFVMNSDGSNPINLTQKPGRDTYPAWSPDGTKIAFEGSRLDGDSEIYVMNADGSNQVNLTQSTGLDTYPAWSPDGTKILFASYRDGYSEIYVMNADGSNPINLTQSSGSTEAYPAWSPDGAKILFTSDRDGNQEIYVMNADGTGQANLTNNAGYDAFPAWQP